MGISALLAAQILDASATGRSVITGADASAIRTTLGLGTLATQSPTGTPSASTFLRGDYSWQTIDLSGYVPYSGATGAVNLGANGLTASQATLSAGTLNGTVLDIAQTWGGTGTYTGIKYNVTDSGPANAASLLMDLRRSDVSQVAVTKGGNIVFRPSASGVGSVELQINGSVNNQGLMIRETSSGAAFLVSPSRADLYVTNGLQVINNTGGGLSSVIAGTFSWHSATNATPDANLTREGVGILGQRASTNAQTFRIYNTYTDATNNFERGKIGWSGGVFQIGTEKGLTSGAARALELQTDGTTRASIPTTGGLVVGTAALATNATSGFLYVPTCAGTPSGTPASQTGTAPIVIDTTNNKLYFYSGGAWRDAGP